MAGMNREEFVVVGWSDPEGSRHRIGSLLLGYYTPDDKLIYAGRAGTGVPVAERTNLTDDDPARLWGLYLQHAHQAVIEPPSSPEAARRYSPSECVGTRTENITGNTDPKHVSTSYAERANLTMRMAMRRFTRLTNAFSKKLENHAHMVALYALWYNFVRIHKTLRTSPAMAAGIETRLWSMEDVVRLIERREDIRSGATVVE
jgi:ATP-dependent DNA ligase